jgi:hypothetical protein
VGGVQWIELRVRVVLIPNDVITTQNQVAEIASTRHVGMNGNSRSKQKAK